MASFDDVLAACLSHDNNVREEKGERCAQQQEQEESARLFASRARLSRMIDFRTACMGVVCPCHFKIAHAWYPFRRGRMGREDGGQKRDSLAPPPIKSAKRAIDRMRLG